MNHDPDFISLAEDARSRIHEVSIEDVAEGLKTGRNFLVIDIREDREWVQGYVEGSLHIGRGVLERDIHKHAEDKRQEIVLYCGGGYRSALAADSLQQMGYLNVHSMAGGWRGWKEKELPIAKPE